MIILLLGLALWTFGHLFKRLWPQRAEALGEKRPALVSIASFAGIILMVIGYRMVDGAVFWGRHPMSVGVNNLLMLIALYLAVSSMLPTRIKAKMRNPQLTAVKTWAVAHLLVNGDIASFVLFGGMLAWAVATVIVLKRAQLATKEAVQPTKGGEVIAVVGTLALFGLIAMIHGWLGYPVFG